MVSTSKICSALLVMLAAAYVAQAEDRTQKLFTPPVTLDFIENKGQWDQRARFIARIPGGALLLTDSGFVYNFVEPEALDDVHDHTGQHADHAAKQKMIQCHAYRVTFAGASRGVVYSTEQKRSYYHNYFVGLDSSKWAGRVGLYGQVTQKSIYKGIDIKIYSNDAGSAKYDFVVEPHADPRQIKLKYEGVRPELTREGHIRIKTSVNEIVEKAPYTYQKIDGKKVPVKSRYKLSRTIVSFEFPEGYDKRYALIIDPELIYATFSGANGNTWGYSGTYDKAGNFYLSARGFHTAFNGGTWPVTLGAYQIPSWDGFGIAAIAKYNSIGSKLIYATYAGNASIYKPDSSFHPNTLRVNDNDELFVAGYTNYPQPVTAGAYQTAMKGKSDIYIMRFSADGSALLAATYIGSSGVDADLLVEEPLSSNTDMAMDAAGNIWITSNAGSGDFPVTNNAYQGIFRGATDAVLFQMTPDLSTLLYSTYLGGPLSDGGKCIEYNSRNHTIGVVGYTEGNYFPVTAGAYKTTNSVTFDGFALLIDAQSYQIKAATYVGTPKLDIATRLAFDCNSNFYVAGVTEGNYPVTDTLAEGFVRGGAIFLDKLNPTLSSSLASTRTGMEPIHPNYRVTVSALAVDICGNITITTTASVPQSDMPLTADAFENKPSSFYMATFKPDFAGLKFGSYFGSGIHTHPGISRIDKRGILYQAACALDGVTNPWAYAGNYFPATPGAYSVAKFDGGFSAVCFKVDFKLLADDITRTMVSGGGANDTAIHAVRGCKSAFIHYNRTPASHPAVLKLRISGTAVNGIDYQLIADSLIIPANQGKASVEIKPLLVSNTAPPDPRYVVVSLESPCNYCTISFDTVWIYDSLYVALPPAGTTCSGDTITLTADVAGGLRFSWTPAHLIPNRDSPTIRPAPDTTTRYSITVLQPEAPPTCPSRSKSYIAYVEPFPQISLEDITGCSDDSIAISAWIFPQGIAYKYKWSPTDYLRNDYDSANKLKAPEGRYRKILIVSTPGAGCTSIDSTMVTVLPPFAFDWISPLDTTINLGDSIYLSSESSAVTWLWQPATYLNSPTVKSPLAKPLESMVYTLTGYNEYGCKGTDTVKIKVNYLPKLIIPNAFSPNGDGLNDVFKVGNLRFAKLLVFRIFNRYGQLVFESNDPSIGWDGLIKGKPCDMGTYYYLIGISSPLDGEAAYFKGDLSLIR